MLFIFPICMRELQPSMCSQQWSFMHVSVPESYFETAHEWHSACEAQPNEINGLLRDGRAKAGKEYVYLASLTR